MVKKNSNDKEFFNKKARFNYKIDDSFEVGVVLLGSEIKAIRSGRVDMSTSYAKVINGEVFWIGGSLNIESGDRQRTRKLLLHKKQIIRLASQIQEKGLALIPLKLYFKKGKIKMELGLGRGMKKYEKREIIKKRDQERDAATSFKKIVN